MKNKLFVLTLFSLFCLNSQATEINADEIAEGGRIYDKWWKELKLEKPSSTHPSYPATSKKQGASSWRCKECHGWDYKGAKGIYGQGSHATGIKGINSAKSMGTNEIVNVLKNNIHGYTNIMSNEALIKVARFIKYGQVDISKYINKKSKLAGGNLKHGKKIFIDSCKKCHGNDGRSINFKTNKNPEFVGTVAQHNPWEAIHKIRNGQPHTTMPNMNAKLDINMQIDLLTYLQSLPVK